MIVILKFLTPKPKLIPTTKASSGRLCDCDGPMAIMIIVAVPPDPPRIFFIVLNPKYDAQSVSGLTD